jgi:calcineurin-like phosphoesterase family protein
MNLPGVYDIFNERWSGQTVWIYSDTHFDDKELAAGTPGRLPSDEQVAAINAKVGRKDVFIHLGDVGNIEHVRKIRGYKILIMGNHDAGRTNYERKIIREKYDTDAYSLDDVKKIAHYKHYGWKATISEGHDISHAPFHYWELVVDNQLFDEVYEGPLMIGEKLILSHEPLDCSWAFNIHGHDHSGHRTPTKTHLNVCSDVIKYTPLNLNNLLKTGLTSYITSIHRSTIDTATKRKQKRTQKKK